MERIHIKFLLLPVLLAVTAISAAQQLPGSMSFTVSMQNPSTHYFHVNLRCGGIQAATLNFKMPAWTPGYYQLLNYAKNVEHFSVTNAEGKKISWKQADTNNWQLQTGGANSVIIDYDVKATTAFVAQSFLDETHGYIIPASLFLYIDGQLQRPVTLTIEPYTAWANVATGLDAVEGRPNTFTAPDFDMLYDCPILIGNLEELPGFMVKGIPHRFIGYKLGEFDRQQFMNDLKKVVEGGAAIIGNIPYKHYTFLAIGPGRGGIEHLTSTTISFNGSQLNTAAGKRRMLSFIAHEYFHHYNVKRIRPIELGPFDYDKGSRTKQLWISEGLTVYYEYLILKRMGLMTQDELLEALRNNIMAYENKPGHLYQSVAQASYETWSDGPFGRTGDEVNKTISYYDKGPALGMLLDFAIRHETGNKRSLDDVMRLLYYDYYKQKNRGFTEDEFRAACEKIAGKALPEFFEYVYTVKDIDYPTYFNYAGLQVDTTTQSIPGVWLGIDTRERNDSIAVSSIDWNSPAWNAGLRQGDRILEVDGQKINKASMEALLKTKQTGDLIKLLVWHNGNSNNIDISLGKKAEKKFTITLVPDPSLLQQNILKDWLKN